MYQMYLQYVTNNYRFNIKIKRVPGKFHGTLYFLELMAGFEPATGALRMRCSTTEPHQPTYNILSAIFFKSRNFTQSYTPIITLKQIYAGGFKSLFVKDNQWKSKL